MEEYYIYILLETSIDEWENLIKEFIEDGVYFDDTEFQKISENQISLTYSKFKAPINFEYTEGIPFRIENIPFFVENSRKRPIQKKISDQLKEIQACITLKIINRVKFDEIVWSMLDHIESYIAGLGDGVIFTQDGNFYNKELEKIYKL